VVICEGLTADADGLALADRVARLLDAPLSLDGTEHYLTVSMGIALARPGDSAQTVLSQADAAMYRAKERGRARAEVFDDSLRLKAAARLDLKSALRRSVDEEGLDVVYQPVISLADGHLVGAEALVRWLHPTRGPVPPTEFIPIAEETGLIAQIGRHVLAEALGLIRRWRQELPGGEALWVAVNLSARQLQDPGLADMIAAALLANRTPSSALHVEITESVLIDQLEVCSANLAAIGSLGVPISLDDFGTGYASLAYLKRYPIDTIKVDRSFVTGLGADKHDSSIVAAIVALGHAFGLDVLAEGVETPLQLASLRALGCDHAQGFLWSEGLPDREFSAWATTQCNRLWLDDDIPTNSGTAPQRAVRRSAAVRRRC
jgi:EAL domain-containing protein (putative c-di-GMP-specific phosphodiesterase class I)